VIGPSITGDGAITAAFVLVRHLKLQERQFLPSMRRNGLVSMLLNESYHVKVVADSRQTGSGRFLWRV
jgi:hypothetical protein